MSTSFDPLNDIGMSHSSKMSYWEVYVSFNGIGCVFCALLINAVYRLKDTRTSNDILAAALCLSCFVMSLSCGMQCLLNTINGHFSYGHTACYCEAFFHLISITTMFFILALMAYNSYRTVLVGESMPGKHAMWSIFGIWVLCSLGVGLFSLGSPIYMSPSGVFCFFTFDSMLMYAFFAPSFLITFGAMVFLYFRIFTITRATLKQIGHHLSSNQTRKQLQMRLAQKLFLFVVVFLSGWCVLVAGVILQLILGQIYELDAIGGVLGVIHSLAVPLLYGLINSRIRARMFWCFSWCETFGEEDSSPRDSGPTGLEMSSQEFSGVTCSFDESRDVLNSTIMKEPGATHMIDMISKVTVTGFDDSSTAAAQRMNITSSQPSVHLLSTTGLQTSSQGNSVIHSPVESTFTTPLPSPTPIRSPAGTAKPTTFSFPTSSPTPNGSPAPIIGSEVTHEHDSEPTSSSMVTATTSMTEAAPSPTTQSMDHSEPESSTELPAIVIHLNDEEKSF